MAKKRKADKRSFGGEGAGSVAPVIITARETSGLCKDYVSNFEMRIGFCLDKNDAGNLATSNYEPFKGLEKPNKAIFVNRQKNVQVIFRPFVVSTDGNVDIRY